MLGFLTDYWISWAWKLSEWNCQIYPVLEHIRISFGLPKSVILARSITHSHVLQVRKSILFLEYFAFRILTIIFLFITLWDSWSGPWWKWFNQSDMGKRDVFLWHDSHIPHFEYCHGLPTQITRNQIQQKTSSDFPNRWSFSGLFSHLVLFFWGSHQLEFGIIGVFCALD